MQPAYECEIPVQQLIYNYGQGNFYLTVQEQNGDQQFLLTYWFKKGWYVIFPFIGPFNTYTLFSNLSVCICEQ